MPCSICRGDGRNITTRPSLLLAQAEVDAKRDELASAERNLASLQRRFMHVEATNVKKSAAEAKNKKTVQKEKGQSKGTDSETEAYDTDPYGADPEGDVP